MELIKIIEREGRQLVSGRELHEFLEIRTKYKDWFRRMVEYGFEEEIDFIRVAQKRATNNLKNSVTTVIDHVISIDMAKEISMIQRTETRIHHHIIISGMDRDKAEELWGKGMANANRMQANELGFEELANYLSKDPRGKKRWSQSKNIVIPMPEINDYKYSNKKLYELSQNQGEREVFEKLYPGFIYTGHDVVFNDVDGGIYVYIKMRRLE